MSRLVIILLSVICLNGCTSALQCYSSKTNTKPTDAEISFCDKYVRGSGDDFQRNYSICMLRKGYNMCQYVKGYAYADETWMLTDDGWIGKAYIEEDKYFSEMESKVLR